jgi:hypothetical protein
MVVMIAANGIRANAYADELVDGVVTAEALFW